MGDGKERSTFQKASDRLQAITAAITGTPTVIFPAFDNLPKVEGQPQGCCWGLFDEHHSGKKDEIGTINLLTPTIVQAASKEIKTGEHVQLDWPLDNVQFPGFGRKEFSQKVINLKETIDFVALDDEVYINTQSGSQWDSLKHVCSQIPERAKAR